MRRLRVLPFLCVGLVGLGTAACGSGGGSGPTAPDGVDGVEVEQRSFQLLNDARANAGVTPAFMLDPALTRVARDHSESMRDHGYFGHRDPQGRNLVQRLADAGVSFSAAAENLARVTGSPDPAGFAHGQLLQSQEHRDNILSRDFLLVGVGVARAGDTFWITQVFLKP